MMLIESKKTKQRQYVSESEWLQMKQTKDAMHFNVISRGEANDAERNPIPIKQVKEHIDRLRELQQRDEPTAQVEPTEPTEQKEPTKTKLKRKPTNTL